MDCSNKEVFDILCKREKEIYGVGILWIACGAARVTIIVYGSHDGFENKERLGRFQALLFPLLPLGKMKHLGARLREVLDCQALRKGLSHVAFVSFKHKVRSLSKHSKDEK